MVNEQREFEVNELREVDLVNEQRDLDLTDKFGRALSERGITRLIGFNRLGPAVSDDPIMDTRVGCQIVADGVLHNIEFSKHAHYPHVVPKLEISCIEGRVTGVLYPPDPEECFFVPHIESVVSMTLNPALEVFDSQHRKS